MIYNYLIDFAILTDFANYFDLNFNLIYLLINYDLIIIFFFLLLFQ